MLQNEHSYQFALLKTPVLLRNRVEFIIFSFQSADIDSLPEPAHQPHHQHLQQPPTSPGHTPPQPHYQSPLPHHRPAAPQSQPPSTQAVYAKVQRRAERNGGGGGGAQFSDAASAVSSASASTTSSATGNQKASTSTATNNNQQQRSQPQPPPPASPPDASKLRTFHVTLYKDTVYDDYGFSLSDGLYERGVFINRIRSGGPADVVGLLKPFDRIMQVKSQIYVGCGETKREMCANCFFVRACVLCCR